MSMNLNNLMKQAQEMQKKMQQAQEEIARMEITGESGGGLVKVTMNGQHKVKRVELSAKLKVEERDVLEDLEVLSDLIAAAFNSASEKVEGASKDKLSKLTAGLNLPEGFGGTGAGGAGA